MDAIEIYRALDAASRLNLIQINFEALAAQALTDGEFLKRYDYRMLGDRTLRAVALLAELHMDARDSVLNNAPAVIGSPESTPHPIECVCPACVSILHNESKPIAEQFPDYKVHDVVCVQCYTSGSGNKTWKALDETGGIIYLRQAHREMLEEAGLWGQLDKMRVGHECEIEDGIVHTVQDGDFRKPVQIEGDWKFQYMVDSDAPDTEESDDVPGVPENEISVIEWADRLLSGGDVAIVDLETTDLDGYPIEAAVIAQDGTVLFDKRIKPPEGEAISQKAFDVHGIDFEAVRDCPEWGAVASDFADAINGKTVVIYNAEFDLGIIRRANAKYGIPLTVKAECAMLKYAEYNGDWNDYHGNFRWVKLTQAARALGVTVTDEHSAVGDARMTLEVIKALAAKAKSDKSMPDQAPF